MNICEYVIVVVVVFETKSIGNFLFACSIEQKCEAIVQYVYVYITLDVDELFSAIDSL